MAESRKIVKSGNTSFVLSLPIDWIRKNNLKQGSTVKIDENETGNLVISSERQVSSVKKDIVTIKVDGRSDEDIYLDFMTKYIRDPASIIFEGKEISSKDAKILEFVKSLIGLDVIERSTDSIIVKNFFSLDKELSPEILLKKMDIINRAGMEILSSYFVKDFAKEDFFEIQKLNEQNDRLFILARKCILKLIEKPSLMNSLKTNHLQIMKDRVYAQAFSQISSALLVIARAFQILDLDKKAKTALKRHFNKLAKEYKGIVNAINNKMHDEIYAFLLDTAAEQDRLEEDLKLLEDPLAAQVTSALISIYEDLRTAAYEELA